jgi:hypothetical protein
VKEDLPNKTLLTYEDGKVICLEDEVVFGTIIDQNDDDAFDFPGEYTGKSAKVVRYAEGSNMLTVRLNESTIEVLVYPHWISFERRGA